MSAQTVMVFLFSVVNALDESKVSMLYELHTRSHILQSAHQLRLVLSNYNLDNCGGYNDITADAGVSFNSSPSHHILRVTGTFCSTLYC